MTARRFAERTDVPVGRTQDDAKARLRAAGADQIMIYEAQDRSAIAFRLAGRFYRIDIPTDPKAKDARQDERRAWRLLLLLMKAKLEAVREGATTIEREFLSDAVLPNGSTVGAWASTELTLAYESGAMPKSLMLEGPAQ